MRLGFAVDRRTLNNLTQYNLGLRGALELYLEGVCGRVVVVVLVPLPVVSDSFQLGPETEPRDLNNNDFASIFQEKLSVQPLAGTRGSSLCEVAVASCLVKFHT